MRRAYKVLADVIEVFAVFLQRLLKQHGLRGAPLLHLIAAEHRTSLRNQGGHGFGQVIVVLLQCVHSMELKAETGSKTTEVFHRTQATQNPASQLLCTNPLCDTQSRAGRHKTIITQSITQCRLKSLLRESQQIIVETTRTPSVIFKRLKSGKWIFKSNIFRKSNSSSDFKFEEVVLTTEILPLCM